jgi:hypothetical protein
MQNLPHILLVHDETPKFVVGAIVAVIWGINALVSMVKKASAKPVVPRRPAGAKPPVAKALTTGRQPVMAMRQGNIPPFFVQRAQAQVKKQKPKSAPARKGQRTAPALVAAVASAPVRQPPPLPRAAAVVSAPSLRPATSARGIFRLGPKTLRDQIILTELLQKPVSLRDTF